jgi:hypothetical protein
MASTLRLKNYIYRYLDNRSKVFYVSRAPRGAHAHVYTSQLQTVPMLLPKSSVCNNVLLGFTNADRCNAYVTAQSESGDAEASFEVNVVELEDFKQVSGAMRMPMAVVMNSYCVIEDGQEHHEIFFHNYSARHDELKISCKSKH